MKHTIIPILFIPALAITVGAAPWRGGQEIELDEAEVFIEFNSTDEDFGIQFFWDGSEWDKMRINNPDKEAVLRIRANENLAEHGLTEGFFESAEPSVDELSMAEFFERFPEGEYEFEGRTLDGIELEGETEFTHTLPAPPANLYPADGDEVDMSARVQVSFDAVTEDLNGQPLVPEQYEVIVETEGDILQVFSIILKGDVAEPRATIPPEFLEPGTEYKFEVIVQEESGNRTISETEFSTR